MNADGGPGTTTRAATLAAIPADRPRVRLGLLLDGMSQPAWVCAALRQIAEEGHAEIVVAVLDADHRPPPPAPTFLGRLRAFLLAWLRAPFNPHHLWGHYAAADARYYNPQPSAHASEDLSEPLRDVPRVLVSPRRTKYSDYFPPEAVEAVRAHRPDALLRLGFRILRGEILGAAPCGVWSWHHGDNRQYRGGPALFWEMFEGNPASGVVLQVLSEELDNGLVLQRGTFATHPFSLALGRNAIYWSAAPFAARALRDLRLMGWEALRGEARAREAGAAAGTLYRTPTNRQMLAFLRRLALRRREYPRRYREQWDILLRPRPAGGIAALAGGPDWRALPCPADRFYADPCLWREGGRSVLFFEDYSWPGGKGRISCAEALPGGGFGEVRPVLERPYHLSAPQLFRHGGRLYLVPESCANKTVELYRCLEFPLRWEPLGPLLTDVRAVDPKIVEHDGRLWLFVNMARHAGGRSDELHVFSAPAPEGPFAPHARNPVRVDAGATRPAGGLFREDGRLLRPAQDCTGSYGRRLCFQEVERLDMTGYAERQARCLEPEPFGGQGVHSYTAEHGLEAVDRKRIEPCDAPYAARRLLDYPFLPVLWPAGCFFPPLRYLVELGVALARRGLRLWRRASARG